MEPSEELEELNEISPTCSEDESLVVEEHSAENRWAARGLGGQAGLKGSVLAWCVALPSTN